MHKAEFKDRICIGYTTTYRARTNQFLRKKTFSKYFSYYPDSLQLVVTQLRTHISDQESNVISWKVLYIEHYCHSSYI